MISQAMRKQRTNISRSLLRAIFGLGVLVTSHNAFAQLQFYPAPMQQIEYELTRGAVQLLEPVNEPMYPTRASSRGITGWVEISFDIDPSGQVIAESVEIIGAEPRGMFDSSTIRTVEKFRFTPFAPNGTAQYAIGVQYRFQYSIL